MSPRRCISNAMGIVQYQDNVLAGGKRCQEPAQGLKGEFGTALSPEDIRAVLAVVIIVFEIAGRGAGGKVDEILVPSAADYYRFDGLIGSRLCRVRAVKNAGKTQQRPHPINIRSPK